MSEPTEQDMEMLRGAEPSWMSGGLAGDVTPYYRAETNLDFPTASIAMHESGGEEPGAVAAIPGGGDGGPVSYRPFQIVDASEDGVAKIRVIASAVAGFPIPEYSPTVSGGGYVWVGALRNEANISSAYITHGATPPASDDSTYIIPIGTFSASGGAVTSISNHRYGPVNIALCRNWFANPPKYTPLIS